MGSVTLMVGDLTEYVVCGFVVNWARCFEFMDRKKIICLNGIC